MSFQKKVEEGFPSVIPGERYSHGPEVVTVKTAGEGGVTVAGFCWLVDEDTVVASGAAATGKPYGLVIRTKYESTVSPLSGEEASMHIAEGSPASVALKGERVVVMSTAATAGQLVLVDPATGAISAAAAAAGDLVDTGWKVITDCEANQPCAISTWRN